MQKREIILVGVMALTLAVGAVMYFAGPGKGPAAPAPGASKATLDEVTQTVAQFKLTPQQAYRIGLLLDNATADPFYGGMAALSQEDDRGLGPGGAPGGGDAMVYSGYMKIGQKIFAVINGVEYARGDELAEGGYRVQAIDKNFVLLERTDGSTGRKLTRRVPLVEDDTDKIRIRVVKKR